MRASGTDAAETWRAVSDSFDQTWTQIDQRLAGLDDVEALGSRQPIAGRCARDPTAP
jgi:hypothetical protein